MNLLLDTHVLLWWETGFAALPDEARAIIADPDNTVFVSTVSLWEIWLKHSLGKLRLPLNFEDRLSGDFFEILPLTAGHARQIAKLPWLHKDPFDRMLVAQAEHEQLFLMTADKQLGAYGDMVLVVG
ncbi:MAG: type II toxin-antitoxin system VapC family toxin [Bryobacteraceae bacterium]